MDGQLANGPPAAVEPQSQNRSEGSNLRRTGSSAVDSAILVAKFRQIADKAVKEAENHLRVQQQTSS